jgi:predicted secreted protein
MNTIIKLRINESHRIELESRGAWGLQLLYRVSNPTIVTVERVEAMPSSFQPGDPIKAIFQITGCAVGETEITFYDTQPWTKDFEEIARSKFQVEVTP